MLSYWLHDIATLRLQIQRFNFNEIQYIHRIQQQRQHLLTMIQQNRQGVGVGVYRDTWNEQQQQNQQANTSVMNMSNNSVIPDYDDAPYKFDEAHKHWFGWYVCFHKSTF
jgi:hypothetical protein